MNWISVDELLPDDQQEVLTYWPEQDQIQVQRFCRDYAGHGPWWMHGWQSHQLKAGRITHWMPLPASPVELETIV